MVVRTAATTAKHFLCKPGQILYCADFKDSASRCSSLNYMSEVPLLFTKKKKDGQEHLQTSSF